MKVVIPYLYLDCYDWYDVNSIRDQKAWKKYCEMFIPHAKKRERYLEWIKRYR